MPQDSKKPGLTWSTPKNAASTEPASAPQEAAPASKLGFPSSKKTIQTQAPMYASFLVAGIVIGVLLATAQASYNQGGVSSAATSSVQQQAAAAVSASSAASTKTKTTPTKPPVVVSDQRAGSGVSISALNIARPTWVVVYVSREGKPGNALGARLFFAGDKQGTVGLLRNTQAGQSYFVGLSVDDGDRKFSLSKDKSLADADGGPLWATFRAL